MKRLFAFVVCIVSMFILSGCMSESERKINRLNREIEGYQNDIAELESELGEVRAKIKSYGR